MNLRNTQPEHISTIFNSIREQIDFSGTTSRTKTEFADECNINTIVNRSKMSGVLPQGNRQPMFGDFSEVSDYTEAQTSIAQAQEEFINLPSDVRAKFNNNVADLLDFIDNPANAEEAQKMGLIPTPEVEHIPAETVVSEVAEPTESSD